MGVLAWKRTKTFLAAQLRRLVVALESQPELVPLVRTCIPDDMNPSHNHVLQGSLEGIACLNRRHRSLHRDMAALKIACEVVGRAMAQEKERGDQFETALLQERKRSEEAESRVQAWVAV
jgi:hypothetical protein